MLKCSPHSKSNYVSVYERNMDKDYKYIKFSYLFASIYYSDRYLVIDFIDIFKK